jgi:pimeloyl-ACP methyl ester carboxylesterase
MPLLTLLRLVFGLLSLVVLGAGAYLVWSWWQGGVVVDARGIGHLVREDWRLWTGAGLLLWSLAGRFVLPLVLARPDEARPLAPAHHRGKVVQGASGASLYVESLGPPGAPVIVLTHGWGLDSTIWERAKAELSTRYRIVTWDLPGLGRSRQPKNGALTLDRLAADLATIVELSRNGPVVLVGHSIGGMTIQTLARLRPDLFGATVAGVILLNTTHTNPLKTMIFSGLAQALRWPVIEPAMRMAIWLWPVAWLGAWQSYLSGSAHLANRFGFGRYVTRGQLQHTTLLTTRNSPAVQAKGNLAMFRWDATAALSHLACPTLVIGGDLDIVTKPSASETIAAAAPLARLQVVEGVNHMGFLERAEVYNAAIARFASTVFGDVSAQRDALEPVA